MPPFLQQNLNLLETNQSDRDLIEELRLFKEFGAPTQVESLDGIDYYINEYWTSRQRQGNRLHEVSYRACFKPQLPRFFIDRLTQPGDVVYDPFMGRGTTLLEAALCGRIPYGNDTNPLSRALVEPRLCPPALEEIKARLEAIPWDSFDTYESEDLLTFYHPETLAKLEGLRNWLLERSAGENDLDKVDAWIRMVAINRLTGHSAGFFSVYTLPPNQAVTVKRQKLINEKRQQIPPLRDVPAIIFRKSKSLLSQEHPQCETYLTCVAQSESTPGIADASVKLTVTSPPFLDVVDYEGDNWLRCWFLGVDPKSVRIASHKKVPDWERFIRNTLKELDRVTVDGGYVAFEVGEVRHGKVKLEQSVIEAARGLPLAPIGVMINQQEFTKTSNCWGVSNNSSGTNSNRIIILRKQTR
mgnify:CR=1 FL=1